MRFRTRLPILALETDEGRARRVDSSHRSPFEKVPSREKGKEEVPGRKRSALEATEREQLYDAHGAEQKGLPRSSMFNRP